MSDFVSDNNSHENSYEYGSGFQSNNAAYVTKYINKKKPINNELPANCKSFLIILGINYLIITLVPS